MLRSYKTEIKPTLSQKQKIDQSIGICRWLYNLYLSKNKELYEKYKNGEIEKKDAFMSANQFDKYINHEVKVLEEYKWINSCGSKARKKAICNAERAYKNFFQGKSCFPRFKKKKQQGVKLYFPKNCKADFTIERHKLWIPTFKWVRLKEKGYIPTNAKVVNGTVSKKADRYYISIVFDIEYEIPSEEYGEGIGIDLGITNLAILSDGEVYGNINKTKKIKKQEKRLKREQKKLSRKYESLKEKQKIKRKEVATRQNINKQIAKVQKIHQKLSNIRTDYIDKTIAKIVERKPSYITIEDLNLTGMMKNKHLSRAIAQQRFYEFRLKLEHKCKLLGIELRIVDPFYPSSKRCNECGHVKKNLKLQERIYTCPYCGYTEDRDLNASLNLRDATIYRIA